MLSTLPKQIGTLTSLKKVEIECTDTLDLPSTMEILQKLEELQFSNLSNLDGLSDEIANLANLKSLSLPGFKAGSIPPSICQLRSLQILDLSLADRLSTLPEEIGNLTNLNDLFLCSSWIRSLPSTIGELSNLKLLSLSDSKIRSLPSTIGNLSNLEALYLGSTNNLVSLPEDVTKFTKLKILELHAFDISSLHRTFGKNTGLMHLDITGLSGRELADRKNILLDLVVNGFPFLGFIGCLMYGPTEVEYALACNRARDLLGFGSRDKSAFKMTQNMWPTLLQNATRASQSTTFRPWIRDYTMENPDAIYHLLTTCTESFLSVIANRNMKNR